MRTAPKTLQKSYPVRPDIDEGMLDQNSSLALMLQMAGRRKDVLDVGCASGYLAKLISAHECNVMGIEVNAEAAEAARAHCTRVFLADLDFASLKDVVEGASFDVMMFGDVLEHLREPARLLQEARELIRADGYVVASIPNIAHGAIRLSLLHGAFDYSGMGILDETHLKFFTLKTIEELFVQAGYEIRRIERTKVPIFDHPDGLIPNLSRADFSDELVAEVQRDSEHDTLQFVVQAFPLGVDERAASATKHFITANTELAATQNRAQRLSAQLEARNRSLEETKRQLIVATEEMVRAQESFRALAATEPGERTHRAEIELVRTQERLDFANARVEDTRERFAAEIARLNDAQSELQARVLERQSRLEAAQKDRETLSAEIAQLRERVLERQSTLEFAQKEREKLAAEMTHLRERILERQSALESTQNERDRLSFEMTQLRDRILERQSAIEAAHKERDRLSVEIAQLRESVLGRQSVLEATEKERDHLRAAADELREELRTSSSDRRFLASEVERVNTLLQARQRALEERSEDLSNALAQADATSQELEDLRGRFLIQTDALIDRTRRETQQLTTLIDVVQTSKFWSLKRFLARLAGR